jgi:hypothetical protein
LRQKARRPFASGFLFVSSSELVMQNLASVEVDRPINDVFELTNDHVAEWSNIVVEDKILMETPDRVGTTFRSVTEDHGKRMEFQGVVKRYDPPRLSSVKLTGDSFDIDVEYAFDDLGGRTRVTQQSTIHAKGFFKVFLFCCGWIMRKSSCKATQNELENLKRFCEEHNSASA